MLDFQSARRQMVDQQVRTWEVLDEGVLEAMASVPREAFVPAAYREIAYADVSVPLPHGQRILPPKVDGRILQALDVQPADKALEIGTGSGFLAACLSQLAAHVHSIEIHRDLSAGALEALQSMGVHNVDLEVADAMQLDAEAAFDVIAVTGSLPVYDSRFEKALRPGGRLFVVTGPGPAMTATRVTRANDGGWLRQRLFETSLDPLLHSSRPPGFEF